MFKTVSPESQMSRLVRSLLGSDKKRDCWMEAFRWHLSQVDACTYRIEPTDVAQSLSGAFSFSELKERSCEVEIILYRDLERLKGQLRPVSGQKLSKVLGQNLKNCPRNFPQWSKSHRVYDAVEEIMTGPIGEILRTSFPRLSRICVDRGGNATLDQVFCENLKTLAVYLLRALDLGSGAQREVELLLPLIDLTKYCLPLFNHRNEERKWYVVIT